MSDVGLFGPGSLTWRVNREGVLLLGGGAALVLQVAHPLVAAGVEEHSNYREDPWGRLYRTLDLTTKIVFGSTTEAEEAAGKSFRNIARIDVMPVTDAGVADVIGAASLLVSEAALPALEARASRVSAEEEG